MAFPTVPTAGASTILGTNQANATNPRTFPNLSSLTENAGDLLIAICVAYQSSGTANAVFSAWGASFTEFCDQSSATTMAIGAGYKWGSGSEAGTFTVTEAATITGHATMIVMAIPGAHATTPPEFVTKANGTTTAADPGALTPSWGAEDTLWIAVAGSGETATGGAWNGTGAAPTNYTDTFHVNGSDVLNGSDASVAFRQLNAASEDVGTWTTDLSNARNSALLIAVRPAPVLSFDGILFPSPQTGP